MRIQRDHVCKEEGTIFIFNCSSGEFSVILQGLPTDAY